MQQISNEAYLSWPKPSITPLLLRVNIKLSLIPKPKATLLDLRQLALLLGTDCHTTNCLKLNKSNDTKLRFLKTKSTNFKCLPCADVRQTAETKQTR